MKQSNRKYFYLGLISFYIIISFIPKTPVIFLAFLLSSLFFYLACKNIVSSLLLSLVLSVFSDIGIAGNFFLVEPPELKFGPGYLVTPMTMLIMLLFLFSFKKQIKNINSADILILIFFIWSIFSYLFFPYTNVLFGIFAIGELLILYYIFRLHISKENMHLISIVLISTIIFQSTVAVIQFFLKRPIGLLIESSLSNYNYGVTTSEDVNFFRLAGTFSHPNNFAAVLLTIIPFLIFYDKKSKKHIFILCVSLLALFFSYSRAAWGIFGLLTLYFIYENRGKLLKYISLSLKQIIQGILIVLILVVLSIPYVSKRIESSSLSFEEGGSFDIRGKLYQEGLSIITQYPITGVGLNQSVEMYVENPVSDILTYSRNKIYRIHNAFLEIASETGIPGFILFSLFLIFVFKYYTHLKNKTNFQKAAFYGLLGLIGISMFNPFFHTSQFRLFFLLSAIILV